MKDTGRRFLQYLQHTTRVDVLYYLENSRYLLVQQAISVGSTLALAVVFARYLSRQTYGEYQFVLALISIFSFLSVPGMSDAAFSSIVKGYDGAFSKGLKLRLKWGLLGTPVLSLLGGYYFFYRESPELGLAIFVAALFFPLLNTLNTWSTILRAKKDFRTSSIFNSVVAISHALILISVVLLGEGQLVPIMFCKALPGATT